VLKNFFDDRTLVDEADDVRFARPLRADKRICFVHLLDFGMNLQEALDAPTFYSAHFPSSFYPRTAYPGRMVVEGRIPREVTEELERHGHEVVVTGGWENGEVMGIRYDRAHGVIMGGVSTRRSIGYALGW